MRVKSLLMPMLVLVSAIPLGASPQEGCTGLLSLNLQDVQITAAELLHADKRTGLPEYCDVVGTIRETIGVEVRMPTNWNQKMYFGGNGGFAGNIEDTWLGLSRGYATISTDTGHQNFVVDASWALDDRVAERDYGYVAVHKSAILGKIIIEAYYKRSPKFSYFDGCSNGGRQALMEAQKYPADFDGIVAGAPALDWTGLMIGFNWDMQALQATETTSLISAEQFLIIADAVLEECDAIDGLVDGLVNDPRKCHFKPEKLLCMENANTNCLSQLQVDALKKISSGPKDSTGNLLHPGFPMGALVSDFGWISWLVYNPDYPAVQFLFQNDFFRYMAFTKDNPNFDWKTFNFDTDPQRMRLMSRILNATNADLSRFHQLGGKLLMYHGWSDSAVPPGRTIEYYRKVRKHLGAQNTSTTVRLFMVPGMLHCGGGPGPSYVDYLTVLEQWVEEGVVPVSMEARHDDNKGIPDRTRPLCPYPMVARYNGSGSINKAANFTCVAPPK